MTDVLLAGYDDLRRKGLAGPEKVALRDQRARELQAAEQERQRAERIAKGMPASDFEAPAGARCCDWLAFGRTGTAAADIYLAAYRASNGIAAEASGAPSTEPLLVNQ